jgi:hypothetical protein
MGSDSEPGLCVVYLAWGPLGIGPVRDFLRSYRERRAGVPHRLVVLLNGVQAGSGRDELLAELGDVEHRLISLDASVLDLVAYRRAAEILGASRYCFLNSYSRVLADDWLAHMDGALEEDVGIVAATGSWASMLSYGLFQIGLPSSYREVFGNRRATLSAFEQLHTERTGEEPPVNPLKHQLGVLLSVAPMLFGFRRFPAYHVRSNSFAIAHEPFIEAFGSSLSRKVQTHRLESGRNSLTAQIERRGMRAVVVDRHGRRHGREQWASSETFWQGDQRGLLIADNQTDYYEQGDARRRELLARYAWGEQASPL